MTDLEFKTAFAPMITHVGKQPTSEQLRYWHEMLNDLDAETVRRAIILTLRDYQYAGFPPVGLVRKHAGATQSTLAVQDRSTVAWAALKAAVASVGGYRSVQFDDPLVTATIRALGGWVRFCDCEAGEKFDVWLRKEFDATYRALMATGIGAEQATPLAGILEVDNSLNGYEADPALTATVATRLPALPDSLIRGAIESRPVKAIAGPVRDYVESLGEGFTALEVDEPELMTKRRAEIELQVRQHRLSGSRPILTEVITDPKAKPFTGSINTSKESA